MDRTILFGVALIVAVCSLLLAIYYALPGVSHVLVSGSHPPQDPQPAHIALFSVLAVLGLILALVNRPGVRRNEQRNDE